MNTLVGKFNEYTAWREGLQQAVVALQTWMRDARLSEPLAESRLARVAGHLADDKLTVAFVAEFSRGKSELINSIFFADYGRRILPSAAGRTTMCPTELLHDGHRPPEVRLLPIETRAGNEGIADYKTRPEAWHVVPLDIQSADGMLAAISEVSKVKRVPLEDARAYGLYDDTDPDQVAAVDRDGRVEVSMWRHAIINFPHPLLSQGLVILDTPGLNAIGSEPELTLSMIPNAHAVMFVLAADTGVTKSDIEVWRSHISGARQQGRMVVLNKIDSMWDDLKSPDQVAAEIERQVYGCSQLLGIDMQQVFPVSAQKGLLAKVNGDGTLLARSGLPALEQALTRRLIPQKLAIVRELVGGELHELLDATAAMLEVRSESIAQQLADLQALHGKNAGVVAHMMARVRAEKEEFDKSLLNFQAVRQVHARLSGELFAELGIKALRERTRVAREQMIAAAFSAGIRESMAQYFLGSRQAIEAAQEKINEVSRLMMAMVQKFGAEHGMRLSLPVRLSLERYLDEIERIERIYQERFGLLTILTTEKVVLTHKFFESIATQVKSTYEIANRDAEAWLKAVMAPLEGQLREHQGQLRRRTEAIRQIQDAAGQLDERIEEVREDAAALEGYRRQFEAVRLAIAQHLELRDQDQPEALAA